MKNGNDLIESIVNKLNDENKIPSDSSVIIKLRSLTAQELNLLVTFGDLPMWKNERINKKT